MVAHEIAGRAELSSPAIILAVNQPSGDPTPSRADIDPTLRIGNALAPLDIETDDHLLPGGEQEGEHEGRRADLSAFRQMNPPCPQAICR